MSQVERVRHGGFGMNETGADPGPDDGGPFVAYRLPCSGLESGVLVLFAFFRDNSIRVSSVFIRG